VRRSRGESIESRGRGGRGSGREAEEREKQKRRTGGGRPEKRRAGQDERGTGNEVKTKTVSRDGGMEGAESNFREIGLAWASTIGREQLDSRRSFLIFSFFCSFFLFFFFVGAGPSAEIPFATWGIGQGHEPFPVGEGGA